MRIALVSAHLGAHTRDLGCALACDHSVTIYTRRESTRHPARETLSGGPEIVRLTAGPAKPLAESEQVALVPDFGTALAEAWQSDLPDVVHSQSWVAGLAALVGREHSVPIVHTCHGLVSAWLHHTRLAGVTSPGSGSAPEDFGVAERIRLERAIANDVDHLIATSGSEPVELRAMGVRTTKATVIPCGIDLDLFRLESQTPDSHPDQTEGSGNHPRLLLLDGLSPPHGVDSAISALPGIPGAELVVAGGPPPNRLKRDDAANRVRALADRRGVGDRVQLLGAVPHDELPALISSADVVLSVPWYEPDGTAALQAMACGRAVIATPVGALRDVVIPGTTGTFVPPGNPRRLAAAVRGLLGDPLRMEGYGLAGRERAEFRHSWSRIATETAQVYRDLPSNALLDVV